jgi:hypothetical protein
MVSDHEKRFYENLAKKKNNHTPRARRRKMERELDKLQKKNK